MRKIIVLILLATNIHAMNMFQLEQERNILPLFELGMLAKNLAEQVGSLPAQPVTEGKHTLAFPRGPKSQYVCTLAKELLSRQDIQVKCKFKDDPSASQPTLLGEPAVGDWVIEIPEGSHVADKKTLEKDYLEALQQYGRGWKSMPAPQDINYRIYTKSHADIASGESNRDIVLTLIYLLQAIGLKGAVYQMSPFDPQIFIYLK